MTNIVKRLRLHDIKHIFKTCSTTVYKLPKWIKIERCKWFNQFLHIPVRRWEDIWGWCSLHKTDCDSFCLLFTQQMVSTAAFGRLMQGTALCTVTTIPANGWANLQSVDMPSICQKDDYSLDQSNQHLWLCLTFKFKVDQHPSSLLSDLAPRMYGFLFYFISPALLWLPFKLFY